MICNAFLFFTDGDKAIAPLGDVFRHGVDWQAAYNFWTWSNDALGGLHMYTAMTALLVGAVTLARRKGDITHRLLGLIYVCAQPPPPDRSTVRRTGRPFHRRRPDAPEHWFIA